MGKDKALLSFRGRTLVECVAQNVREAAGSVTLVGQASRYETLGLPVIEDKHAGCGPLSGIVAALAEDKAEWNLVVACDMPNVTAAVLRALLDRAEATQADAVIPIGPSGIPDPLCAVYRRTCLGPGLEALAAKRLKVTDAFAKSVIDWWKVEDRRWLVNTNTPEEWTAVVGAQTVDD
jgi:molybdopterin-guanine dinucleotide biosynthesis protein A